jgi:hypothetical protein
MITSEDIDELGVQKIFPDPPSKNVYIFKENDKHPGIRSYQSGGPKTVTTEWEVDGLEFVNQEATAYFFMPSIEKNKGYKPCGKGSGLDIKLRGGSHPKKKDEPDSAKCYIFDFQYKGGNCDNFQKEYPHPRYYKTEVLANFILKNLLQRWVGFKAITVNQDNGVRCLAFLDDAGINENGQPANEWKLWFDVFDDTENIIKFEPNIKNTKAKEPFIKHHGTKKTLFRMDRIENPEAKFMSVREISTGNKQSIDEVVKLYT